MVERGIAQSPEGRQPFRQMTVEENFKLGAYSRKDSDGVKRDLGRIYEMFEVLGERRHQPAGLFSGGEQQMLAIGRALMSQPKLLMLDEPSMGLSPIMTMQVMTTIRDLQSQGVTILLVEQNAQAALSLADRGYVLEVGQIMFSDTGRNLLGDDRVKRTYLGVD